MFVIIYKMQEIFCAIAQTSENSQKTIDKIRKAGYNTITASEISDEICLNGDDEKCIKIWNVS